jgi:hypothetical protein
MRMFSGALPSRRAIREATVEQEKALRDELLTRLRSSSSPVAVAIDGWTNVVQSKVTNIVLICDGKAFYWRSIANKTEKNTAAWLYDQIEPILSDLVQQSVRVTALIADNEAVNGALYRLLRVKFSFLIHIPCAAHTVQLVVHGCLASDRWKQVKSVVEEVLKSFSSSKDARIQLMKLQQAGGRKVLSLVKQNDTRWNSFLYACERFQLLRPYIDIVFPQAADFWEEVDALIEFLRPFQVATDVIQRDTSTLFDIFQQWINLTQHVKTQLSGREERAAMSVLKQRWDMQVNGDATVAVAILSLDVDIQKMKSEDIEAAQAFIIRFGVQYLRFYQMTDLEEEELSGLLFTQIGQLKS